MLAFPSIVNKIYIIFTQTSQQVERIRNERTNETSNAQSDIHANKLPLRTITYAGKDCVNRIKLHFQFKNKTKIK